MQIIPWVALGGAVGAVARWGVSQLALRFLGPSFPWGTLAVNVIGSFLLGVIAIVGDRAELSPGVRALLATGLMGAFTTFSTFSVETIRFVERGEWVMAGANVAGNGILSLVAAGLGLAVARATWP